MFKDLLCSAKVGNHVEEVTDVTYDKILGPDGKSFSVNDAAEKIIKEAQSILKRDLELLGITWNPPGLLNSNELNGSGRQESHVENSKKEIIEELAESEPINRTIDKKIKCQNRRISTPKNSRSILTPVGNKILVSDVCNTSTSSVHKMRLRSSQCNLSIEQSPVCGNENEISVKSAKRNSKKLHNLSKVSLNKSLGKENFTPVHALSVRNICSPNINTPGKTPNKSSKANGLSLWPTTKDCHQSPSLVGSSMNMMDPNLSNQLCVIEEVLKESEQLEFGDSTCSLKKTQAESLGNSGFLNDANCEFKLDLNNNVEDKLPTDDTILQSGDKSKNKNLSMTSSNFDQLCSYMFADDSFDKEMSNVKIVEEPLSNLSGENCARPQTSKGKQLSITDSDIDALCQTMFEDQSVDIPQVQSIEQKTMLNMSNDKVEMRGSNSTKSNPTKETKTGNDINVVQPSNTTMFDDDSFEGCIEEFMKSFENPVADNSNNKESIIDFETLNISDMSYSPSMVDGNKNQVSVKRSPVQMSMSTPIQSQIRKKMKFENSVCEKISPLHNVRHSVPLFKTPGLTTVRRSSASSTKRAGRISNTSNGSKDLFNSVSFTTDGNSGKSGNGDDLLGNPSDVKKSGRSSDLFEDLDMESDFSNSCSLFGSMCSNITDGSSSHVLVCDSQDPGAWNHDRLAVKSDLSTIIESSLLHRYFACLFIYLLVTASWA